MKILRTKWRNLKAAYGALGTLLREESTFQIQVFGAFLTVALAYLLQISYLEWLIVILTIGAVLATEAFNTALEELCDHVTLEHHPRIGKIKDLGATASGLIGCSALIIGCLIFIPRIASLL
jgi:diacylglycerol kinase (ATP)